MRRQNGESTALVLVLLMLVFPVTSAHGADQFDPSFGSSGVATVPLPLEASQKEASIVDLATAPDGTTMAALGGLAEPGYFGAARLTPGGMPDPAFGQGGFTPPLELGGGFNREAQAEALAVQGDGKAVVAGYFQEGVRHPTSFNPLLARYLPNGSLDPDFGAGGIIGARRRSRWEEVVFHSVALAPDGRIIVAAGRSEHLKSVPRPAGIVFAFNPNGTLDKGFGQAGRVLFSQRDDKSYSTLRDVEVLGNGKILVAGYHNYRLFLARLRPNGSLDRSFGGGDGRVTLSLRSRLCCPPAALVVQRDGRIVVAANGGPVQAARVYLARFRPNGSPDRSFGNRGVVAPYLSWRLSKVDDIAMQGDGGILTVGQSAKTKANSNGGEYAVFRNLLSGSPDESFGEHGLKALQYGDFGFATAALSQADGGVLTGGSYITVDPSTKRYVTTLLLARFLG